MVIFSALESMLPIILLIILGYVLRKAGWLGDTFAPSASRLIMNVALPASIFTSVLKNLTLKTLLSLDSGLVVCFASVAICYLVALATVVLLKVRPGRRGVMVNTFANANTIFIGMPLNVALFGEGAVGFFLVYYITNTVSTWAVGTFLIDADPMVKAEGSEPSAQRRRGIDIKRLLPPPLIGFLVALVFLLLQLPVPSFVESTLTYTGNLVTPLSLIYIGIVLKESGLTSVRMDRDTVVALVGKFVIAPCPWSVSLPPMPPCSERCLPRRRTPSSSRPQCPRSPCSRSLPTRGRATYASQRTSSSRAPSCAPWWSLSSTRCLGEGRTPCLLRGHPKRGPPGGRGRAR